MRAVSIRLIKRIYAVTGQEDERDVVPSQSIGDRVRLDAVQIEIQQDVVNGCGMLRNERKGFVNRADRPR